MLRNLEIAHTRYAIPRLPAQFRDSENAWLHKFPDCAEHIYCVNPMPLLQEASMKSASSYGQLEVEAFFGMLIYQLTEKRSWIPTLSLPLSKPSQPSHLLAALHLANMLTANGIFFPALIAVQGCGMYAKDTTTTNWEVDGCYKSSYGHPSLITIHCPHDVWYRFQVMCSCESPCTSF